jgi:hypothetical protein
MTPKEAMWVIKAQLQKTPQNMEAARVLENIVNGLYNYVLDDWDLGTEANHVKNFFTKSDDEYKVLHDGTAALDDDSYEPIYNKVTGRKK